MIYVQRSQIGSNTIKANTGHQEIGEASYLCSDWRETPFWSKNASFGCDFVELAKSPQRAYTGPPAGFLLVLLVSLKRYIFRLKSGFRASHYLKCLNVSPSLS